MLNKEEIKEDLRRWFKEKWVDISRKDSSGKHPECGASAKKRSKGNFNKGYPKCRPSKRVSNKTPETSGEMTRTEKKKAASAKRRVEMTRADNSDKTPHIVTHRKSKS